MFGQRAGKLRTGGFYNRYTSSKETKFFDTTLTFTIPLVGAVPATGQLNLIEGGSDEDQRVGRKAFIKSIYIKGVLTLAPAAATDPTGVTMIYVVWDKQCNGAAAAVTDVLVSNNIPRSVLQLDNSERFVILKKFTHTWNPTSGAAADLTGMVKNINMYKKVNIPIMFSTSVASIGQVKTNNLFLLAGCDSSKLNVLVTMNGTCRLRFTD